LPEQETQSPMSGISPLPDIAVTDDCNYIAAFLTMACPYRCGYCINEFESPRRRDQIISGQDWVSGLSRLTNLERPNGPIPVTLQGGEPSVHPDFYDIINHLPENIPIDILTNLCFDVEEMIAKVNPDRLRRDAPYASIRVSYHIGQVELDELLAKTHRLLEADFSVGVFGVLHPETKDVVLSAQERAQNEGVDFRTKEFLGYYNGTMYGQYKYPDACTMESARKVHCRTTELIIGPGGQIYRCHHDLYEKFSPVGNILEPDFQMTGAYLPCECYGHCNPCDIKVKTNRLQQFGHTSVSIRFSEQTNEKTKTLTGSLS